MSPPKKGDTITCYACDRGRLVVGIETGWERSTVRCVFCSWKFGGDKMTKRAIYATSRRHANALTHRVIIEHDGEQIEIKPADSFQIPLIDDLLLPD